jgi:hypothetical protein
MSIARYFTRRGPELRMRRGLQEKLAIRVEGAVLAGEKSAKERRAEDAVMTEGECYSNPEDYDPVLKSHCRL